MSFPDSVERLRDFAVNCSRFSNSKFEFYLHFFQNSGSIIPLAIKIAKKIIIINNTFIFCSVVKSFAKAQLSHELEELIIEELSNLFPEGFENRRFAVRSSAVGEDSDELSSAGQNETILGCKGLASILEAIQRCWGSLFSSLSVEYRRQNGQQIFGPMGVVIQEMVAAESAGVIFSRDPLSGDPSKIIITANYGLGEVMK